MFLLDVFHSSLIQLQIFFPIARRIVHFLRLSLDQNFFDQNTRIARVQRQHSSRTQSFTYSSNPRTSNFYSPVSLKFRQSTRRTKLNRCSSTCDSVPRFTLLLLDLRITFLRSFVLLPIFLSRWMSGQVLTSRNPRAFTLEYPINSLRNVALSMTLRRGRDVEGDFSSGAARA